MRKLIQDIFTVTTERDFESVALQVFKYQYHYCEVYRSFCDFLKISATDVQALTDIPFLPIQFFKSKKVIDKNKKEIITFSSSGTTGSITSKHHVVSLEIYTQSFITTFESIYGPCEDVTILALLPSYLERSGSSLVYMADTIIHKSNQPNSGFYLDNYTSLIDTILQQEALGEKTILLGVSYALLDLIEIKKFNLQHTIVMETGGMKGRRREMVKEELHKILEEGFGVSQIHSEYGMTELLSQAYSTGQGVFKCPPWMRVLTRDTEDALSLVSHKTGGINVIDLANLYSCSFIATQDLGKVKSDHSFEIIGRFDHSDIRGCNLMVL